MPKRMARNNAGVVVTFYWVSLTFCSHLSFQTLRSPVVVDLRVDPLPETEHGLEERLDEER